MSVLFVLLVLAVRESGAFMLGQSVAEYQTTFKPPFEVPALRCQYHARVPARARPPRRLPALAALRASADGPPGGFNSRDFIAVQLIGADAGRQGGASRRGESRNPDDCPSIFLGPTLQIDDEGNVDLKSRLDFTDSTTASGMRRAVPIPMSSDAERELVACLRGYEALDPSRVPGRVLNLLERGQAFIKTRSLHEGLPLSPDERRAAIQRIQQMPNAQFPKTPLDVALALWREASCTLNLMVLDEVESLELDDAIAVGAYMGYSTVEEAPETQPGEVTWLQSPDITPALAVAMEVKAGVPLYLRRAIYEKTLCRVLSKVDEDSKVGMRVDESQVSRSPDRPCFPAYQTAAHV